MHQYPKALLVLLSGVLTATPAVTHSGSSEQPQVLAIHQLPAAIQQTLRSEGDLEKMNIAAVEVDARDLNHDGRKEWIITAIEASSTGLRPVNRAAWVFVSDGQAWHKLKYLGFQLKTQVHAQAQSGNYDSLKVILRDSGNLFFRIYEWRKEEYMLTACGDENKGTPLPCKAVE